MTDEAERNGGPKIEAPYAARRIKIENVFILWFAASVICLLWYSNVLIQEYTAALFVLIGALAASPMAFLFYQVICVHMEVLSGLVTGEGGNDKSLGYRLSPAEKKLRYSLLRQRGLWPWGCIFLVGGVLSALLIIDSHNNELERIYDMTNLAHMWPHWDFGGLMTKELLDDYLYSAKLKKMHGQHVKVGFLIAILLFSPTLAYSYIMRRLKAD